MKTESAVWERVSARNDLTAEQALLPERLTELMTAETQLAAAFFRLARRLPGADGALMRRLGVQAEARTRKLRTACFLLTGMRSEPHPAEVPFYAAVCEALRAQCLLLIALQKKYDETAREFSACEDLPENPSSELPQTLRALTRILEKNLCC